MVGIPTNRRFAVLFIVLSVLPFCASRLCGAERLKKTDLYQLTKLCAGRATRADEVKEAADALLAKFPAREDQALIYYTLADMYASGSRATMREVGPTAEKALELGLDLERAMSLYCWWASAVCLANGPSRGGAMAEVRRQSAIPSLRCIRLALDEGVPYELGDRPVVSGYNRRDGNEVARYREEMKQYERWQVLQGACISLESAIEGLEFMYSRQPFATKELETMAKEILKDDAAVKHLMKRVEKRIEKRMAEREGKPLPHRKPAP